MRFESPEAALAVFLEDHPGHARAVGLRDLGRGPELALKGPAMRAFVAWVVREGLADADRATASWGDLWAVAPELGEPEL